MKIIGKIICMIIFHPIKAASYKEFGKYNMKLVYLLYILGIFINSYFILLNSDISKINNYLLLFVIFSLLPILLINSTIFIYKKIIELFSEEIIPYDYVRRIIMPYLLVYTFFFNIEYIFRNKITLTILTIWLGINFILIIKYRVNSNFSIKNIRAFIVLILPILLVILNLSLHMINSENKKEQSPELIREETYLYTKQTFDYIDEKMKSGVGLSVDEYNDLYVQASDDPNMNHFRSIEIDFRGIISEMEDAAFEYNYAMQKNDLVGMEKQKERYEEAKQRAIYYMDNYVEK